MNAQHFDAVTLFWQAGPVVRAVVILLVAASTWCWGIVLTCTLRLSRLRVGVKALARGEAHPAADAILHAGRSEAEKQLQGESAEARRSRILGCMRRRVQETVEQAQGGLANLAVISSVAPFVGLLGTVWGIMTSFISIASAKDTSLAVVAPGIAEALAATAIGLAAAIPAAFFYNRFAVGYARTGRAMVRAVEDRAPHMQFEDRGEPPHLARSA